MSDLDWSDLDCIPMHTFEVRKEHRHGIIEWRVWLSIAECKPYPMYSRRPRTRARSVDYAYRMASAYGDRAVVVVKV